MKSAADNPPKPRRHSGGILALAVFGAVLVSAGAGGLPGWALRAAAAAYWCALTIILASRHGRLVLVTPLYVLATAALWVYSLIPALYVTFAMGGRLPIPAGADAVAAWTAQPALAAGGRIEAIARLAVGSEGEAATLLFAFFLLTVLCAVSLLGKRAASRDSGDSFRRVFWAGLVLSAVGWGLHLKAGWTGAHQIRVMLAPALVAALAVLAVAAWTRAPRARLEFGLLWMAAAGALLPDAAKILLLSTAVCIPLVAGRTRRSVAISAVLLGLLAAAAVPYYAARDQGFARAPSAGVVAHKAVEKAIYRQAETVYCLTFALRDKTGAHAERGFHLGPFYFLEAAVPRALWPNKPDLSRGHQYALDYCAYQPDQSPGQSSSITLLGEPFIQAGGAGLVTFCAVLALALGGMSFLSLRSARAAAAVLAMAPWLVDYDQHAALYAGNALKFGLAAALAGLGLAWWAGHGAGRHPTAGQSSSKAPL